MIIIVIVSAVVVVAAVFSLLHSFPFFLFFLCLFFKHFTTITRPSFCHAHFSNRVPIHTCIHTRFTCCVYFFCCCCCCTRLLISSFCVCVFLVLRLFFVDFLFFFTLLATFRLIKDNSVIIIVFSLPFLLLLYSAVYVWVFRLFVFVSPLFMVYYKKLSHCLLLCFNFITSPLLYHFYSKYTTWFYLLYYASRIQLSAFFCTQY